VAVNVGRDRLIGIEDLDGSDRPDRLVGNGSANYLRGFALNDVIIGGGGHDVLEGNRGNDKLDGGSGRDRGIGGSGRDICRRIERKSTCER
jgi:Ca2+-binding RTX toxin-like protein